MKIGIFGGTFNPPHLTHVRIAETAVKELNLDKLLVVPCGDPPHKRCDLDKNVRLSLTKMAFDGVGSVWDYEINKCGKSYTVETLREAKRLYPDCTLYLVIGGDSLRDFDAWYRPDEIASLATLAVAARKTELKSEWIQNVKARYNAEVEVLSVPPDTVSSSEIRLRYRFNKDNSLFVPKAVDEYVKSNGLYGEYADTVAKLQSYLKPKRMEHTFYVVKRGLELSCEGEFDKVFTACLLHDCAKYLDAKDYAKYNFTPPADMPLPVVHSFLGAKVARCDFGVTDPDVLDAIAYHTTGRPEMTRLDKIVYVADKTEQTRPYPLEHLLTGTLDEMFVKCLAEANEYRLSAHGDSDFTLTDQTLKYYNLLN